MENSLISLLSHDETSPSHVLDQGTSHVLDAKLGAVLWAELGPELGPALGPELTSREADAALPGTTRLSSGLGLLHGT